jgi:hypothetical protein
VPEDTSHPTVVRDAARVVLLLGHFDLHEADVRAVRVSLADGNVPTLELDVDVPAASVRETDQRVTLRCTDVSQLSLADFGGQNVVSAYRFAPDGVDDEGRDVVRVTITCAPGCDLDLRCRDVAVVAVKPVGLPR